jgi:CheY-like chemotaxis protein
VLDVANAPRWGGEQHSWAVAPLLGLACLLVLATPALGQTRSAAERQRVVVLHSYHHGFSWSDSISEGITNAFKAQKSDAELVFEFMDARRIASEEYLGELHRLLRVKYAERPVDVVVCSDDQALHLYLEHGHTLFADAPAVFCSVSAFEARMRQGRELTGPVESIEIGPTLDVALQLHPQTRRVAVITDMTVTGQALKKKAEAVFSRYRPRLEFVYLENLTVDGLLTRVSELPDDSIVFLFIFSRDKAGRVFSHERNLDRLRQRAQVPIYAVWDFYLGHGIVGGKLTSGLDEGFMVGKLALRILRGEQASSIALLVDDEPVVREVGQAMLKRFGFEVLVARNGQEALELFRQHHSRVALVILDMTMPVLSGAETYSALRRIRSDVPVIVASGYNEQDATSRFAGRGPAGFIQKPFQLEALEAVIGQVLKPVG